MISDTLAMDERVSLIATIFADKNETEMVRNLSGDDAQAFVDTVDKVMLSYFQLFDSILAHLISTFVHITRLPFICDHMRYFVSRSDYMNIHLYLFTLKLFCTRLSR